MMSRRALNLLVTALFLLLCFASAVMSQQGQPTVAGPFSFAEPIVRLPTGVQDGMGEVILRSSTDQPAPPTLKAVDMPRPLAAAVSFELIPDSNAPPNTWRYRATVFGLAPAASQQHYALVTYADNKTQPLLYTLTNQPAGSFSWSVSKLPDPWVFSRGLTANDNACTAFSVTAKDSPATNVTVSSTLVEQTTKKAITLNSLRLCNSGNKCDGTQPITLPANVPTALQLCTTETFHGNFHGNVVLASREKPDGEIILQNAQFSSFWAKLLGFVLILIGVALAFVAKVWARAKLERDQALMPAILMRTRLSALKETLDHLPDVYRDAPANLNGEIQTLIDELSDNTLDDRHFLPPRFPNPFGFTVDAAGYKAYLEERNPRIQLLSILVKEGVVRAVNEDNGTLTSAQQAEVRKAIQSIDKIVKTTPAPSADQALLLVQGIVVTLHNTLFPPPKNADELADLLPAAARASSSFEAVQLEIESISKGIWLLYGLLTALTGLAVLILNNPGYGVPLDYVFAFFWGFGLPTAIQSLAPSSAASALNISIART